MAESQAPAAEARGEKETNHGLRIFLIWIVPGRRRRRAHLGRLEAAHAAGGNDLAAEHQQTDIAVLALAAAPVMIFVWTYFGYTLINWRHRDGDDDDGPPIFGHTGLQADGSPGPR